ncbi:MAG: aromatic hydrocarbon degradation protein [Chlorobiaceae bacterium]|nr:aromatic hydrocarbon degradation protein [Chlorobiaceae bacterium]
MHQKTISGMTLLALLSATSTAFATNGMNLEGYGAKSHALGGTSTAYDTGNSGVTNNPATLGLRQEGSSELGVGIRGLHPDVNLQTPGMMAGSDGDAYYMPSLSYMRKDGKITWGFAVLAQGGMGTEYGENSPIFSRGNSMGGNPGVPLSGQDIRSEVGVGRLMFPVAYNLTENTVIGASLDFLWASMDLRMDMDGAHFGAMAMQGRGGSVGGSMFSTLGGMIGSGMVSDIDYVRYDFSNDSPFLGDATGYGTGFKVGFTHRFSKLLTVGGSYHSQTRISDLETSNVVLSFSGTGDAFSMANPVSVKGAIKVRNFEWPATFAAGVALYPAERWMISADVKHIDWSSVMEKFSTTFIADNSVSNGPFAGQKLDVEMLQNWKDQTVFSVGVQYRATDRLALRGGASFASNPVPDAWLNPLFPAITENHYTAGFGYRVSDRASVSAALAWAPEVTRTNADGLEISHGQLNWSVNYAHEL